MPRTVAQVQARGLAPRLIKHNAKRRARCHNYSNPGTYMLTVVSGDRIPLFGRLVDAEHTPPYVDLSPLGRAIESTEIKRISQVYPNVEVWRKCVMPDHIHLIVRVREKMPKGKTLGSVVGGFKVGCNKAARALGVMESGTIWEEGYNDRWLRDEANLEGWKRYLADNPRRLAMKRRNPRLFTVMHSVEVEGRRCDAVGNMFLLDIPMKGAVIVHRVDSDETYAANCKEWMAIGEAGGVLVSAAIAEREKKVMHEAMERGYAVIWLRPNGFPKLYKPGGRSFDACSEGRLLQLSPWEYRPHHHDVRRHECLALNELAAAIARRPPARSAGVR